MTLHFLNDAVNNIESTRKSIIASESTCKLINRILFDFINLTQVHNFTVSAQDIFTFRRLSAFTVSFTGILQVLMR